MMKYGFTLVPVAKDRKTERWRLLVDLQERLCRIVDGVGAVCDEFAIELVPSRIVMPEFAGSHRWPLFRFPYEAIEFKVDKQCMRFLHNMQIMAMVMQDPHYLDRRIRKNAFQIVMGILCLLTAVPLTVWLFLSLEEDHDFKSRSFGLICGAAFIGLLLIINPGRNFARIKKARRLQSEAGI